MTLFLRAVLDIEADEAALKHLNKVVNVVIDIAAVDIHDGTNDPETGEFIYQQRPRYFGGTCVVDALIEEKLTKVEEFIGLANAIQQDMAALEKEIVRFALGVKAIYQPALAMQLIQEREAAILEMLGYVNELKSATDSYLQCVCPEAQAFFAPRGTLDEAKTEAPRPRMKLATLTRFLSRHARLLQEVVYAHDPDDSHRPSLGYSSGD